MAASFDLRLRTMEILHLRDPGQSAILHHDPANDSPAPLGPSLQPEPTPSVEPERGQAASVNQDVLLEDELNCFVASSPAS